MKTEDFTLILGDDEIPWRLFSPSNATKTYCVLWLQGWTGSMNSHREGVERMVKQTGITFATLDFAGHGMHTLPIQESTRKQQQEEIIAVFDELRRRGYQKIIVIGGSFGGYMAALLTATRPIHAVVLRCPANYDDRDFTLPFKDTSYQDDYASLMKSEAADEILRSSRATKAIQQYGGFTYVLEHELDEVVPAKVPKNYFAAAKHGNYIIIPNTKHSPKLMRNPAIHFAYIEQVIVAIIKAVQLQDELPED